MPVARSRTRWAATPTAAARVRLPRPSSASVASECGHRARRPVAQEVGPEELGDVVDVEQDRPGEHARRVALGDGPGRRGEQGDAGGEVRRLVEDAGDRPRPLAQARDGVGGEDDEGCRRAGARRQ